MMKKLIPLLLCLFTASCESIINFKFKDSNELNLFVESAQGGEGSQINSIEVDEFYSIQLYAVARDENGEYTSNPEVTWELSSATSIGTLTPVDGGKAAEFEALLQGSGEILVKENGKLVRTIDVTVLETINNVVSVDINNVTSNNFEVSVETQYPLKTSDTATLYYCNTTKIPDCNPKDWYSISMTKNNEFFEVTSPTFKFPDDPTDEINTIVSVNLNSGLAESAHFVTLDGPQQIYRSIGVGNTTALETRTSSGTNDASITDSIITFDQAIANNIGIGDAIVIDDDAGLLGFEKIYFIRKRISSTTYLLNDVNGDQLASDILSILDWRIYRAYTSVPDTMTLTENTGIPTEVNDFDTSQNAVLDNKAWHFAFYADAVWSGSGQHRIEGWNIAGNNFLRYFVPFLPTEVGTSQRHSGQWDTNKARILWTGGSDYDWPFVQRGTGRNAVRIDGFQFEIDDNGFSSVAAYRFDDYLLASGAYVYFHHNIIKGTGAGLGGSGGISMAMGTEDKFGFIFSNIAYNLSGSGFRVEGDNTYATHNTSYNNDWNYVTDNSGASTVISNISQSGGDYAFRGSYSSESDYNFAEYTIYSVAPGPNSVNDATLPEIDFLDTTPGSENLCTTDMSIAYISGPKMIEESDPFKIYYDATGTLRRPSDTFFPVGACTQF